MEFYPTLPADASAGGGGADARGTAPGIVVVRRSGEVQAGGWLPDHVTLGILEAYLPAGEIEELIEDFGCAEERQRLLPAAMTVRLVMAMTLVPDGPVPEVICRAAGLLAYLPWARPWHVPGTEAVTRRRDRSEEHTSELQSPCNLVCRLLLEKKKKISYNYFYEVKKAKYLKIRNS